MKSLSESTFSNVWNLYVAGYVNKSLYLAVKSYEKIAQLDMAIFDRNK